MRNLTKYSDPDTDLLSQLAKALVQKYKNTTDKKARYRPKNPDKKPLGDPKINGLNAEVRRKLKLLHKRTKAAA